MDSSTELIISCGLFILLVALIGGIANWSITDARMRGKSGFLIFIAVFFFFPLGWIAWLLFRPPIAKYQRDLNMTKYRNK